MHMVDVSIVVAIHEKDIIVYKLGAIIVYYIIHFKI